MKLCPKCAGQLEVKNIGNEEIDVCTICEGIWFDAGELEKVISAELTAESNESFAIDQLDGTSLPEELRKLNDEKCGKCPSCGSHPQMDRKQSKGIFIDQCPTCNGV